MFAKVQKIIGNQALMQHIFSFSNKMYIFGSKFFTLHSSLFT